MSIKGTVYSVNVNAYPTNPQVSLPQRVNRWSVENQDAANTIVVSFNGIDDHATLVPGKPSALLTFTQNTDKLWIRTAAPAVTVAVQVISEW